MQRIISTISSLLIRILLSEWWKTETRLLYPNSFSSAPPLSLALYVEGARTHDRLINKTGIYGEINESSVLRDDAQSPLLWIKRILCLVLALLLP